MFNQVMVFFFFFLFCFVFSSGASVGFRVRCVGAVGPEDEPCRKLPRGGRFLFFIVAEKGKKKGRKAQQVRVGFPVEPTDGSAHIRRLGNGDLAQILELA